MSLTSPIRADVEEHREALLRAACGLVAEHGRKSFTARDIAERAGLSQATLYRHFPSKAALIDAVSVDRWERALSWAEEHRGERPAVIDVVSILERFSNMVTDDRDFIANLGLTVGQGPSPIVPVRDEFDLRFGELWNRARGQGHIRAGTHHQDVMELVGAIREPVRRTNRLNIVVDGFCLGADASELISVAQRVSPPWDHDAHS
ncbi:transcriptional regulator [Microbacterium faecale]|uniref:Transcriptional regulator n=1 Tax=Microbacterium faecale TaxID=1804630 RepID=A0A917DJD9_9MICO|nr:TetR/AcrR family transcriptional regulator [Microbacterium faecale]GGD43295.1 transcriptional regulator [Microbacterium faecale]